MPKTYDYNHWVFGDNRKIDDLLLNKFPVPI